MSEEHYVIPFERLRMTDVDQVGGKNASLGEMISQLASVGVRVPSGFATTATAFRDFLNESGLTAKIDEALGKLDTDDLDARTMAARRVPGLHFIGEVVDVTGWLGGYNFQWAWSSGWAAGTAIADASR